MSRFLCLSLLCLLPLSVLAQEDPMPTERAIPRGNQAFLLRMKTNLTQELKRLQDMLTIIGPNDPQFAEQLKIQQAELTKQIKDVTQQLQAFETPGTESAAPPMPLGTPAERTTPPPIPGINEPMMPPGFAPPSSWNAPDWQQDMPLWGQPGQSKQLQELTEMKQTVESLRKEIAELKETVKALDTQIRLLTQVLSAQIKTP